MEPEDIQGILDASAWRGDADRDSLPTRDEWRQTSGWGHLNIGNAYQMMDTTLSIASSNYRLYHDSITGLKKMSFTVWAPDTGVVPYFFYVPSDAASALGVGGLTNYRERPYLLDAFGKRWEYMVRSRTVESRNISFPTL